MSVLAGYAAGGWAIQEAVEDTEALRRYFGRKYGAPKETFVTGHSMGGWASYLLPIEHPDWFAAAFPASGPVTQGAYTGIDFKGCDKYSFICSGVKPDPICEWSCIQASKVSCA